MTSLHGTQLVFLAERPGLFFYGIDKFGDSFGYLFTITVEIANGAFFCVDEECDPMGPVSAVGIEIKDDTDLCFSPFDILS